MYLKYSGTQMALHYSCGKSWAKDREIILYLLLSIYNMYASINQILSTFKLQKAQQYINTETMATSYFETYLPP